MFCFDITMWLPDEKSKENAYEIAFWHSSNHIFCWWKSTKYDCWITLFCLVQNHNYIIANWEPHIIAYYICFPNLVAYYDLMNYIILPNLQLWYEHHRCIGERNIGTKLIENTKERSHGDAIELLKTDRKAVIEAKMISTKKYFGEKGLNITSS